MRIKSLLHLHLCTPFHFFFNIARSTSSHILFSFDRIPKRGEKDEDPPPCIFVLSTTLLVLCCGLTIFEQKRPRISIQSFAYTLTVEDGALEEEDDNDDDDDASGLLPWVGGRLFATVDEVRVSVSQQIHPPSVRLTVALICRAVSIGFHPLIPRHFILFLCRRHQHRLVKTFISTTSTSITTSLNMSSSATTATTATATAGIGFIGLGIMGQGMVARLVSQGVAGTDDKPLVVWNRTPTKCQELVQQFPDATIVIKESPCDVVRACDVTYSMLSTPEASQVVFDAPDTGTLAGVGEGKCIVDCATLAETDMQRMEKAVTAKGGRFLEAPVSGSKGPAIQGSLIFLCAGDQTLFDQVKDNGLQAMGKASHFFGTSVGAGTRAKLVV
eukprot:scaffold64_cov150-Amphora_coffeaeformis.AAC.2